jgi:hypothetical protein
MTYEDLPQKSCQVVALILMEHSDVEGLAPPSAAPQKIGMGSAKPRWRCFGACNCSSVAS